MPDYTIIPFSSAPRIAFNFDGRILYTSGRFEQVHLLLNPGEGMEPHAQPMDVLFFIIEGEAQLTVGEERLEVAANTTVHIKQDVARAWTNTGTGPLRLLVSKLK